MIREATKDDLNAILEMGEKFFETTSYKDWASFSRESAQSLAEMIIDTGILLIAESGGVAVGMVGLVVAPFMFNSKLTAAYEVFWWVEPHARGGTAAWSLLKAIEPAAKKKNCAAIQMVTLHSSPPQAAEMYKRIGYKHTETSFTKILEGN